MEEENQTSHHRRDQKNPPQPLPPPSGAKQPVQDPSHASSVQSGPQSESVSEEHVRKHNKRKGMALMICMLIMSLYSAAVIFLVFSFQLPSLAKTDGAKIAGIVVGTIVAFYIVSNTLWDYLVVLIYNRKARARHLSSPLTGIPPLPKELSHWFDPEELSQGCASNLPLCGRCNRFRPLRTHHCKECGICTIRFDHHCGWLAGCVGGHNYGMFLRLVYWSVIGLWVGVAAAVAGIVEDLVSGQNRTSGNWLGLLIVDIIAFLVSLILAVGQVKLLRLHRILSAHNMTTCEMHLVQMEQNIEAKKEREIRLAQANAARVAKGLKPLPFLIESPPSQKQLIENAVATSPFDLGSKKENMAEIWGHPGPIPFILPFTILKPGWRILQWERNRSQVTGLMLGRNDTKVNPLHLDIPAVDSMSPTSLSIFKDIEDIGLSGLLSPEISWHEDEKAFADSSVQQTSKDDQSDEEPHVSQKCVESVSSLSSSDSTSSDSR